VNSTNELTLEQLQTIVDRIRALLYLEQDATGPGVWNPQKMWSADTLNLIAQELADNQLVPTEVSGACSTLRQRRRAMQTVLFQDSEARGRNGWFRMRSASFYVAQGRVNVDVVSRHAVCPGPVFLELSPKDARQFARAILKQAKAALHPPAPVRPPGGSERRRQQLLRRLSVSRLPRRSR
jgi:hypothetical protein